MTDILHELKKDKIISLMYEEAPNSCNDKDLYLLFRANDFCTVLGEGDLVQKSYGHLLKGIHETLSSEYFQKRIYIGLNDLAPYKLKLELTELLDNTVTLPLEVEEDKVFSSQLHQFSMT